MSIHAWRWPQMVAFWICALVISAVLVALQLRAREHFSLLLPYPKNLVTLLGIVRTLGRELPLFVIAFIGVPLAGTAVTLYWLLARGRTG